MLNFKKKKMNQNEKVQTTQKQITGTKRNFNVNNMQKQSNSKTMQEAGTDLQRSDLHINKLYNCRKQQEAQ